MATPIDTGRSGINVSMGPGVSNPFRGALTEGTRKTVQDIADYRAQKQREENPDIDSKSGEPVVDGYTYADGPGIRGILEQDSVAAVPREKVDEKAVAIPDSKEDPGAAVQALSLNQSTGSGNGAGLVRQKEAPSLKIQQQEQAEVEGRQVLFDNNKIPKPMESSAFSSGLISFGLSLLSGASYAEAFNSAGSHFDKEYGREKREIWANDLRSQGYDDHEIQAWIASGDNKVLTDPEEKKAKQIQMRMQQAQLKKAELESSDEWIQHQLDRETAKDQLTFDQFAESQRHNRVAEANAQANINLARERLEIDRKKELRAEKAAEEKAKQEGEKYNAGKSTAENHFYRAQSGLKNYLEVSQRTGGKVAADRWMTPQWLDNTMNAKAVDLALSGDPVSIDMARKMAGDDVVETLLAEKEWLSPVMRKDSGAAVSHSEWNNMGNIYFPRPGDSPEKQAMKSQAREVVTISMNPNASKELRRAVDAFSSGALPALRLVNGQAYAGDGKGNWRPIPMSNF